VPSENYGTRQSQDRFSLYEHQVTGTISARLRNSSHVRIQRAPKAKHTCDELMNRSTNR
jgi:hypothetical protein